ncbi:RNA helicase [Leifsonia sp. Leaf325]|nr:DEAD/DEAH box helicase [Leifsonia sp. Leaf325]KQQ93715.1 RNA helicase [Leifsonia sp. Leaf325]
MPNNKKPAGGRPAKNFDPYARSGKGGPKSGSRSPGHRGYKPESEAPAKKARWNADERAERAASGAGDRRSYGNDRPQRGERSERPAYGQRSERPAYGDRNDRAPRGDRTERPAYGDRAPRGDRPSYSNDRPQRGERSERPAYGQRSERPAYGDRNDRGARSERPAYGDRNARTERPAYNDRNARTERPAYNDRNDRGARSERPAYGDRTARPSYGNDRPSYNNDRPQRGDRPAYGKRESGYGDRPREERAPRAERTERPAYNDRAQRSDRPAYNASERPPRRDDRGGSYERPGFKASDRSDSKFYPARGAAAGAAYAGRVHGDQKGHFTPEDDVVLERLEAQAIEATDVDGVSFGDLGLGGNIVAALTALGAASPFPIQAATIPVVLEGRDVLGRGKTGSGKTIAFAAPTVELLMKQWAQSGKSGGKRQIGRKPRALILAPTRELALQIDRTVQPIAQSVGLFTTQIYGGVPQYKQVGALQRGVDIVIGTPGRIEDLIEQGRLDLSDVAITVLDEADHMCDLGFLEPVQRILRHTKDGGQKLLFSATLDKGVATLVNEFLVNPAVHEVAGEDQASSTIDHRVLVIEHRDKAAIIEQLADRDGKTLVFARTRAFAEQLADLLDDAGIPAVSLHGDLNQGRRTRNLAQLTSGRVSVLVATDVAARGIHVDDIDLVIQADAPDEYKTYLHRAGRTGRAGKQGTVVTLIPRQRQRRMSELLERAEISADFVDTRPGDELLRELAAL